MFLFSYLDILLSHYLLTKRSACLIFESINSLEIKASMLFSLAFANNTILSCFFFLTFDFYFFVPEVTTQIFNPIAELVISIGISSKEVKAETEIHPVIAKAKIRNGWK